MPCFAFQARPSLGKRPLLYPQPLPGADSRATPAGRSVLTANFSEKQLEESQYVHFFEFALFSSSLRCLLHRPRFSRKASRWAGIGSLRFPAGGERLTQPRQFHFVRRGKTYDFTQGYRKRVQFSRTFDGVTASFEFGMVTYPKALTPQELAAGMKSSSKIMAMMGLQQVVLKSGPTRFGKRAAILQPTRGAVYRSRETMDDEMLTVLNSRRVYTLTKTLTGLTLPPRTLAPIEKRRQAFQTQIAASGD